MQTDFINSAYLKQMRKSLKARVTNKHNILLQKFISAMHCEYFEQPIRIRKRRVIYTKSFAISAFDTYTYTYIFEYATFEIFRRARLMLVRHARFSTHTY